MQDETQTTTIEPTPETSENQPDTVESVVQPQAVEEVASLNESELASIRNYSNQSLQELIAINKPLAEQGDKVAALWLAAATREHVEIRGVALPVEAPATSVEG